MSQNQLPTQTQDSPYLLHLRKQLRKRRLCVNWQSQDEWLLGLAGRADGDVLIAG